MAQLYNSAGLDKLHRLVESTQALLEAGECSGCQLSQLLGKWMGNAASSAAAQRVSECLSICAEGRLAKISNLGLGGEGTANNLCISSSDVLNLGADWFPFIVATDASNLGQGIEVAHAATETSSSLASIAGNSAVVSREERVRSIESTGCSLINLAGFESFRARGNGTTSGTNHGNTSMLLN